MLYLIAKKAFVVIITLLFCLESFAQSCIPGTITFYYQSDVDSFEVNYPNCTEVEGNIVIVGNNITNLYGLNVLTSIGGYLKVGDHFSGSSNLQNLEGLNNLLTIGGDLIIWDNDSLKNFVGLENVTSIGGDLRIYKNQLLFSLEGLNSITSIGGDLYIGHTSLLTNLAGLNNLVSIGGGLEIGANQSLTNIDGLSNLSSIGGAINISGNPVLENLDGLQGMSVVNSDVFLYVNVNLSSISGLNNISAIHGYLNITGSRIESLEGLNNLTSINGELAIVSNQELVSLHALEKLNTLSGRLRISLNDKLTTLSGIDNIISDSIHGLRIIWNHMLTDCAKKSICDYLSDPNDTIVIHQNAGGCNSQAQVDSACVYLSNEQISTKNLFTIYPNPISDKITVKLPNDYMREKITMLKIINTDGHEVFSLSITEPEITIDLSWMANGFYIAKVMNENEILVRKLLKY